ncbi:aldolase [Mycena floridula]|nr:aldolase [Mycena floridula]
MSASLLTQIASLVILDVDSMDPATVGRHSEVVFTDMTSNQAIVYNQALLPRNANLLGEALEYAREYARQKGAIAVQLQDAVDLLTVLLAKAVYPSLKGNVHVQTSPSTAYDTDKTISHAQALINLFEANGIPRNRVCVKIPATPESIVACAKLQEMGIQTLATCLFSLEQAVAASQANCLYIAPYFNELRVHFEPTLWVDFSDPGRDHPMASVIRSIVQVFKAIGSKTLVMPASIVTAKEVVGLVSLTPDHLTLSDAVLAQLAELPEVPLKSFATPELELKSFKEQDYLANGAVALRDYLAGCPEDSRKLADALRLFAECEVKTKEILQNYFSVPSQ